MSLSADIDLQPVREALLREFGPATDAARIDSLLQRLLHDDFRDVRVPTFVTIFLLRSARRALAAGLQ